VSLFQYERRWDRECIQSRSRRKIDRPLSDSHTDSYQQPMFVDDVKLMNEPETIVSSKVWTYSVDVIFGLCRHSVCLSARVGFVLLATLANREVGPIGFNVDAANQLTGHVVQGAAKVMNGVPKHEWNVVRDGREGWQDVLGAILFRVELGTP
jgi:hypothetical protein